MGREAARQLVKNEQQREALLKSFRRTKLQLLAALPSDNDQQLAACDVDRLRTLVETIAGAVTHMNQLLREKTELSGEVASEE